MILGPVSARFVTALIAFNRSAGFGRGHARRPHGRIIASAPGGIGLRSGRFGKTNGILICCWSYIHSLTIACDTLTNR